MVDLDVVLAAELAGGYRRQGDGAAGVTQSISQGAATFLNLMDRTFLREVTEPSFAEAAAMRTAMSDADGAKAMALRTAIHVPTTDK